MLTREDCLAADRQDPLAPVRHAFDLPDGVIYLDGNSLGPLPRAARARVEAVVAQEWGAGLIRSWNDAGWFDLPSKLGDKLAPLIGARPGETVVTDTISLNLFKVLAAALHIAQAYAPGRRTIVSTRDNFPTDLYMAQGLLSWVPQPGDLRLVDENQPLEPLLAAGDVAVLMLSHVNYRTGALQDMTAVTDLAHRCGVLTVWDLAHSAGAVPVDLTSSGADFAVGCTYKYLNGGPGAPGFLWVASRHQDVATQPLSGWWSHARPFAMSSDYEPAPGAKRFLCGTQSVPALALVECGLDIALQADMAAVRAKSLALSDLFVELVGTRCAAHPLTLVTPRAHEARGSHVSIAHDDGFAIVQSLIARGVIGDYRDPRIMRFGLAPLYVRHVDVWDAVETLRDILDTRAWDTPAFCRRGAVT